MAAVTSLPNAPKNCLSGFPVRRAYSGGPARQGRNGWPPDAFPCRRDAIASGMKLGPCARPPWQIKRRHSQAGPRPPFRRQSVFPWGEMAQEFPSSCHQMIAHIGQTMWSCIIAGISPKFSAYFQPRVPGRMSVPAAMPGPAFFCREIIGWYLESFRGWSCLFASIGNYIEIDRYHARWP